MTDQDYIRKAVELADGWGINLSGISLPWEEDTIWPTDWLIKKQYVLDALAAQLVRQVDNPIESWIEVSPTQTRVYGDPEDHKTDGPDRTMNTIKAIVDSKILE